LVFGELQFAAELNALGFGIGTASFRAIQDAPSLELRGNAKDRENDLSKV
jgi:hypothetical protein